MYMMAWYTVAISTVEVMVLSPILLSFTAGGEWLREQQNRGATDTSTVYDRLTVWYETELIQIQYVQ